MAGPGFGALAWGTTSREAVCRGWAASASTPWQHPDSTESTGEVCEDFGEDSLPQVPVEQRHGVAGSHQSN